jgi:hypothetical protein
VVISENHLLEVKKLCIRIKSLIILIGAIGEKLCECIERQHSVILPSDGTKDRRLPSCFVQNLVALFKSSLIVT